MNFGFWLRTASPIILGSGIVLIVVCTIIYIRPLLREKFLRFWTKAFSKTKLNRIIATARFASSMSMTMASGIDTDQSLELAQKLCDPSVLSSRIRNQLLSGESFAKAIAKNELFPPLYCRMIEIGMKTGELDSVMEEIARQTAESAEVETDRSIGRIEPALIIIMSLLVGLILLSVMFPLMGIMSAIG